MERCILIQEKLPKRYWVKALFTATHIRNLTVDAISDQVESHSALFAGKSQFGCAAVTFSDIIYAAFRALAYISLAN